MQPYWEENNFGRWIDKNGPNNLAIHLPSALHQPRCMVIRYLSTTQWIIIGFRTATKLFSLMKRGHWGSFRENALIRSFWPNSARCSRPTLRWHFRQRGSWLKYERYTGEVILEHGFPPGSDMIGQILSAHKLQSVRSSNCLDACQRTCFP